jgi:hypothetical protein
MSKRSLLTVLLMLLVAMQSVVASTDVHTLLDTSNDHNYLALEHSHGNNIPVHGHTDRDKHNFSNTVHDTSEQITNQDSGSNSEHCCHCHSPHSTSALLKDFQLHHNKGNLDSLRTINRHSSQHVSPTLRPPITTA